LIINMAKFTSKEKKPRNKRVGVFGTGRFGFARFGSIDTTWNKEGKAAASFTKVAKP